MDIDIETVETKRQLLAFVRFPHELYRGNRYYVPNLDLDELRILDPNRNPSFGFCRAKYWLARSKGNVVAEASPQLESNRLIRAFWRYFDFRQRKRRRAFIKEI